MRREKGRREISTSQHMNRSINVSNDGVHWEMMLKNPPLERAPTWSFNPWLSLIEQIAEGKVKEVVGRTCTTCFCDYFCNYLIGSLLVYLFACIILFVSLLICLFICFLSSMDHSQYQGYNYDGLPLKNITMHLPESPLGPLLAG